MSGGERVRTINVADGLHERFRAAVLRKHGRVWGAIGQEAERALEAHIARMETESAQGVPS